MSQLPHPEPPGPADREIAEGLARLEGTAPDDLDAQIDAAERLHQLLSERLTGEA